MLFAKGSSKRQVGEQVSSHAASAVLRDFDLAGRIALVSGSETDTVRPPTPQGVDVLVHCCEDPRPTAALARCVVAADGRGAAIMLQGMAAHRSASGELRRASRQLAELNVRLDVVQIPDSAERALGAALGAVVFLAQRRRCS